MAKIVNKPMTEEEVAEAVRLAKTGMTGKDISRQMGITYQSVARELRLLGVSTVKTRKSRITDEQLFEPRGQELVPVTEYNKAPAPQDDKEFEARANKLAADLLVTAERLAHSITNMSDTALQIAPLNHRTAALEKVVNTIESLKGTKNGLFGKSTGAVNIVNIISRSMPGRLKDAMPTEDAEVVDDN